MVGRGSTWETDIAQLAASRGHEFATERSLGAALHTP